MENQKEAIDRIKNGLRLYGYREEAIVEIVNKAMREYQNHIADDGKMVDKEEEYRELCQKVFDWTQDCKGLPLQDDINQLLDIVRVSLTAQNQQPETIILSESQTKAMNMRPEETQPVSGDTSDGYHTFNELYEHRHILFLAVLKAHSDKSWRSKHHADGTMFDGWFIAGLDTKLGQATYHLPIRMWGLFDGIKTLENAPEWDGHTSNDVLVRIRDEAYFEPQPASGAALERIEYILASKIDPVHYKSCADDIRECIKLARQAITQAQIPDGSKCNLCHKDMINLIDAYDMIRYLLPLAKGYVHAHTGIKSTQNIIEDAEDMLAAAPAVKGE